MCCGTDWQMNRTFKNSFVAWITPLHESFNRPELGKHLDDSRGCDVLRGKKLYSIQVLFLRNYFPLNVCLEVLCIFQKCFQIPDNSLNPQWKFPALRFPGNWQPYSQECCSLSPHRMRLIEALVYEWLLNVFFPLQKGLSILLRCILNLLIVFFQPGWCFKMLSYPRRMFFNVSTTVLTLSVEMLVCCVCVCVGGGTQFYFKVGCSVICDRRRPS